MLQVVDAFQAAHPAIASESHELPSNEVLAKVRSGLESAGFLVETGKKASEKILLPVLFGLNGHQEKSFEADACYESKGFVIEVEAGRAVTNNQFLKDLFQACMTHNVEHLAIAVRNTYLKSNDFERVVRFFDTLYASDRIKLPLSGVRIVGYFRSQNHLVSITARWKVGRCKLVTANLPSTGTARPPPVPPTLLVWSSKIQLMRGTLPTLLTLFTQHRRQGH